MQKVRLPSSIHHVATTCLAIAVLAASAAPASAQELVTNGGFDTGDFTGFSISGCTTLPPAYGDPYMINKDQFETPSNPYAIFLCDNDEYTVLSQTLVTTPGQNYTVSFRAANTTGQAEGNSVRIAFGGNVIFEQALTGASYAWSTITTSAVAAAGNTEFDFAVYNDHGETFIDDISVVPAVSATPEPACLVLLGTGLLALVPMARRRRAA